jgi:2-keto-4-pentenoate hydratase
MAHVPVLAVADNLHLAIELPDSRYLTCARVGALQLIADNAWDVMVV